MTQQSLPVVLRDDGVHELPRAIRAELKVVWKGDTGPVQSLLRLSLENAIELEIPLTPESRVELEKSCGVTSPPQAMRTQRDRSSPG